MMILCTMTQRTPKFPTALVMFAYGLVLAWSKASVSLELGVSIPAVRPSAAEFKTGVIQGGLPQLPLTLLNSVIALALLCKELYPRRSASPARAAVSLGVCNMALVWFGALPSCHGAGGLAAQHRFGARSSMAMSYLGLVKLGFGLLFGSSLQARRASDSTSDTISRLIVSMPPLGTMRALPGLRSGHATQLVWSRACELRPPPGRNQSIGRAEGSACTPRGRGGAGDWPIGASCHCWF